MEDKTLSTPTETPAPKTEPKSLMEADADALEAAIALAESQEPVDEAPEPAAEEKEAPVLEAPTSEPPVTADQLESEKLAERARLRREQDRTQSEIKQAREKVQQVEQVLQQTRARAQDDPMGALEFVAERILGIDLYAALERTIGKGVVEPPQKEAPQADPRIDEVLAYIEEDRRAKAESAAKAAEQRDLNTVSQFLQSGGDEYKMLREEGELGSAYVYERAKAYHKEFDAWPELGEVAKSVEKQLRELALEKLGKWKGSGLFADHFGASSSQKSPPSSSSAPRDLTSSMSRESPARRTEPMTEEETFEEAVRLASATDFRL